MTLNNQSKWPRLTLPLLLLLLTACNSKLIALPVDPPAVPPLPVEAKQPTQPDYCLPTCSAGLTREQDSWRLMLIEHE